MMWFTADLHLGDTNILHDMDRPFDSVEEMNRKVPIVCPWRRRCACASVSNVRT